MKFTPQILEDVLVLLKQNISQTQIAKQLNVSRRAVRFIIDSIENKNINIYDLTHQKCSICKILKSITHFEQDGASRYYEICKDCWGTILKQVNELFNDRLGTRTITDRLNINRYYIQQAFDTLGIKNKVGKQYKILEEKQCNGICGKTKSINEFSKCGKRKDGSSKHNAWCKECFNFYQRDKKSEKESKIKQALYLKNKWNNDPFYKLRMIVSASVKRYLKSNGGNKLNKSCISMLGYSIAELKAHIEKQFEPWMTWKNWGIYNFNSWDDNNIYTWTWNIDHIIPQSVLPCDSMEHPNFKKCWALENLRPYSAKQNILDGARKMGVLNKIY